MQTKRYKLTTLMKADDIKSIFAGIDENTKELIARRTKKELCKVLFDINAKIGSDGLPTLSPQPNLIMNAFRLCPVSSIRVVILGQDPYIGAGEATGMSFSVPKGMKIPGSSNNIFKCLLHNRLIAQLPKHGDLTKWAQQGVLLINSAFTTVLGTSAAHADIWKPYTNALLKEISNQPRHIIFILLGVHAQKIASVVDHRRHSLLNWGHPSALSTLNQSDNPKNFKYCTAFSRANDILRNHEESPINWCPDGSSVSSVVENINSVPETIAGSTTQLSGQLIEVGPNDLTPLTDSTLWVFTDGGAIGNGAARCKASWGFYATDGYSLYMDSGIVPPIDIPGEVYKSSNQRGELTAIVLALEHIVASTQSTYIYDDICIVTDSQYSISCFDIWIVGWLKKPDEMNDKKNLDLIMKGYDLLKTIRGRFPLKFMHIRSHKKEPEEAEAKFLWKGNDIVDKMCEAVLKSTV